MPQRVLSMSHLAGLVLMIVASLALAALEVYQAFWNAPRLGYDHELVSRTFETITTARALEMAVRDAERVQRNSLLAQDVSRPAESRAATQRALQLLTKLQSLAADHPELQARMPDLARDVSSKVAELERIAQVR